MLKCNEVVNLASDYLDRNLTWKEYFSVKMHLIMCSQCKRFVRHLFCTIGMVKKMDRQVANREEVKKAVAKLPD